MINLKIKWYCDINGCRERETIKAKLHSPYNYTTDQLIDDFLPPGWSDSLWGHKFICRYHRDEEAKAFQMEQEQLRQQRMLNEAYREAEVIRQRQERAMNQGLSGDNS